MHAAAFGFYDAAVALVDAGANLDLRSTTDVTGVRASPATHAVLTGTVQPPHNNSPVISFTLSRVNGHSI